ncbi:MAG TPA: hypothetical protein DEQ02_04340 [Ruminococcaceae bacterium]|nr:hypothetical protein [Oscillospiraceae bacterium]
MSEIKNPHSVNLFVTGVFLGLATFIMSVSVITSYNMGSAVFNDETGNLIYTFCILAWTMGFFAYALIGKLIKTKIVRKWTLMAAGVICMGAFSNTAFAYLKEAYVFSSLLCLFLFGILYAAVYHKTALRMNGSRYTGRLVGISVAGTELLMWPVVSLIANAAVTFATVSVFLIFISLYVCEAPRLTGDIQTNESHPNRQKRTLAVFVIATVLIAVMAAMTENIFITHTAQGNFNIQDWPRLLHGASTLLWGFLADIKKRRYLALGTFCVMMLFSVGIILWDGNYPFAIAMCVYHAFRAAGILFFTVSFLDIAPHTKHPGLWGVGRIFFTIPDTLLLFAFTFIKLNLLGMIVISLAGTMLLFLTMLWGRLFIQKSDHIQVVNTPPVPVSLEELIGDFGFTGRETEVLKLLLDGQTTSQIAAKIVVTENTVQKYISSMMSKCEAESRAILIARFAGRKG